jgi:hypothetical protein
VTLFNVTRLHSAWSLGKRATSQTSVLGAASRQLQGVLSVGDAPIFIPKKKNFVKTEMNGSYPLNE